MTEKVCLCVFVCVMKYAPGKFGPRSLCHHSSSSPPSFPFPFLGKVQSVAQEDQPHLGLCCDASQRATQVHFVANMHAHTHTCVYQRAQTNLVIYVQSVQTEAEGWPHCSGVSGAGLLAHQQTPGTLNNTVLYSTVLCCTCYATAQLHDHLYTWQLLKLYPSIKADSSPTKVHPQSLFPSAWNIQPIR